MCIYHIHTAVQQEHCRQLELIAFIGTVLQTQLLGCLDLADGLDGSQTQLAPGCPHLIEVIELALGIAGYLEPQLFLGNALGNGSRSALQYQKNLGILVQELLIVLPIGPDIQLTDGSAVIPQEDQEGFICLLDLFLQSGCLSIRGLICKVYGLVTERNQLILHKTTPFRLNRRILTNIIVYSAETVKYCRNLPGFPIKQPAGRQ